MGRLNLCELFKSFFCARFIKIHSSSTCAGREKSFYRQALNYAVMKKPLGLMLQTFMLINVNVSFMKSINVVAFLLLLEPFWIYAIVVTSLISFCILSERRLHQWWLCWCARKRIKKNVFAYFSLNKVETFFALDDSHRQSTVMSARQSGKKFNKSKVQAVWLNYQPVICADTNTWRAKVNCW